MTVEEQEPQSVLEEILHEHDEGRELLVRYEETHYREAIKELYAKLYGHHLGEEQHFFPHVKGADPEAARLIVDLLREHHEIEKLMLDVIEMNSFEERLFMTLKEELLEHMEEEETELFDHAREVLSEAKLRDLLEPFEAVEKAETEKAEQKVNLHRS